MSMTLKLPGGSIRLVGKGWTFSGRVNGLAVTMVVLDQGAGRFRVGLLTVGAAPGTSKAMSLTFGNDDMAVGTLP